MRSLKHNANGSQPPSSADGERLPRWLTVEQIRKMQRMRRETVVEAMESGELPYERRGRIRYARLADVLAWEERRLKPEAKACSATIHESLLDLA